MPKFDAGKLAESLEFDFTEAGVDAKGVIPEPSDKAIGEYLDDIVAASRKIATLGGLASLDPNDPEMMAAALQAIDGKQFVAALDEIANPEAGPGAGTPGR
jgi:hypothetical protein